MSYVITSLRKEIRVSNKESKIGFFQETKREGPKANTWRIFQSHLFTEFYIHRFAIAANAVKHPGFDAAATDSVWTQLTRTPVWRETKHIHNFTSFNIKITNTNIENHRWRRHCCLCLRTAICHDPLWRSHLIPSGIPLPSVWNAHWQSCYINTTCNVSWIFLHCQKEDLQLEIQKLNLPRKAGEKKPKAKKLACKDKLWAAMLVHVKKLAPKGPL